MPGYVVPLSNWTNVYYLETSSTSLAHLSPNTDGLVVVNYQTPFSSCCTSAVTSTTCGTWSASSSLGTGWFTKVYELTPEAEEQARKRRLLQERDRARKVHRAKGAIKRALKLIDSVGFGDDIRMFLRGDSIEISHPASLFKFIIHKQPYNGVIEKTIHAGIGTPYKLDLYTKTDVFVASLCVYLKDTPILDQVLAVTMFIKSGDEDVILNQANWFSLTDDEDTILEVAVRYPELENKLKLQRFGPREPLTLQ